MSLIRIEHLYFTYDGGSEPVFEDLDLQLDTDWKLGLVGRNGWGKTTLLRLLEGSLSGSGALTRPDRPVYFPRPVDEPERPAREGGQPKEKQQPFRGEQRKPRPEQQPRGGESREKACGKPAPETGEKRSRPRRRRPRSGGGGKPQTGSTTGQD